MALNYCDEKTGAVAINLGTGRGTSVLELITAFENACGRKIEYSITDRRPGDIDICYADCVFVRLLLPDDDYNRWPNHLEAPKLRFVQ